MESPARPITDANKLTGKFLMEALCCTDWELELESVATVHSSEFKHQDISGMESTINSAIVREEATADP